MIRLPYSTRFSPSQLKDIHFYLTAAKDHDRRKPLYHSQFLRQLLPFFMTWWTGLLYWSRFPSDESYAPTVGQGAVLFFHVKHLSTMKMWRQLRVYMQLQMLRFYDRQLSSNFQSMYQRSLGINPIHGIHFMYVRIFSMKIFPDNTCVVVRRTCKDFINPSNHCNVFVWREICSQLYN